MTETDPQNLKVGFDNAIKLIIHEAQLIWTVFRSMIAVNTFITAFNLAFLKLFDYKSFLILLPSIFGMILCVLWLTITNRMYSYFEFWFASAREFEKKMFSEDLQFLNMGVKYSGGNEVEINGKSYMMSGLNRLIRNKHLLRFIILLIAIIYLITLVYSIFLINQ